MTKPPAGGMVKLSQLVRRYTAKKATSLAGGMSYVVDPDQSCSYCRTLQLGAGQRKHAFKPYEPGSQDDVGSQADGQPRKLLCQRTIWSSPC